MEIVTCTLCGKTLEYAGGLQEQSPKALILGSPSAQRGLEQWYGTACTKCRSVFCDTCVDSSKSTPCPKCGQPTVPAARRHLEPMGVIRSTRSAVAAQRSASSGRRSEGQRPEDTFQLKQRSFDGCSMVILIAFVLVIAGIGYGVYFLFFR